MSRFVVRNQCRLSSACLAVLILLIAGCARLTEGQAADVRKAYGIPADLPMIDLGAIELRAGRTKHLRLSRGREISLTAAPLTNGLVRLDLDYQSQNELTSGTQPSGYTERKQLIFDPAKLTSGWRICGGPFKAGFVVALQPIITP